MDQDNLTSRYDDDAPTEHPVTPAQPARQSPPKPGPYDHLFDYAPPLDEALLEQAQQTQPITPVPPGVPKNRADLRGTPPQSAASAQAVPQPQPQRPTAAPPPPPPPATPPTPRRHRRRLNIACLGCGLMLLSVIGVMLCGGVTVFIIVWNSVNSVLGERLQNILQQQQAFQTARIFDRDGNELYQLIREGRRTQIRLADVSKHVIDATIAVEDSTFYTNPGVDAGAIARAGLQYFVGNEGGGASTITQQLIRQIAFDPEYRAERSARRKIEEILMALVLTRQKTKDEILEMYLNTIPYGNLAYGIEAAAQTYFGKSADDLTLAEAALLAGLPQAPALLDPLNPDPKVQEAVLARRKVVLDLMVERGKISRAEANAAAAQPLTYANPNVNLRSPHFTLYAQQELSALFAAINLPEKYITTGGLSVYTTLDSGYQELVERVARAQIDQIKLTNNAKNAAVVVLKPATGEILAMMGSVDYRDDSIDGRVNVAISPRQPGSSIKALTYAAAMEKGLSAASVLWDVETHIGIPGQDYYSPRNYDRTFHGPVRVRDALANSYNIPAVQTLRQIGVDTLLEYAERVGITSLGRDAARYGLSLTLGGGEVTPLEMAQAYSVFANDGQLIPVTSILCVINSEGNIVYQYENGCAGRGNATDRTINGSVAGKAVLDPRIAFVISDILADNVARSPAMGARSPLRTDGLTSSVKTGTTDNYRDNWTVGYTKNVVISVWVGNTDSSEMKGTTGLTGAAPIWNGVITGIYANPALMETLQRGGALRSDELLAPPGVSKRPTCNLRALINPSVDCQPGRSEWMLDSPPLVPGADGKLAPSQDPRFVPTPVPANGPYIEELDPGVIRALVQPLDPGMATALVSNIAPGYRGALPPPPQYCLVPNEVRDQVTRAIPQVFIKAPVFADDDMYARLYAQGAGLAIAPKDPCTAEMLLYAPQVAGVTAVITAPRMGDTVTGTVNVFGTAAWGPGQALYYKMELTGPQFPTWTTFSGPFQNPVVNGQLGNFGASGLLPGLYQIRIVVVGMDANHLVETPPVHLNITGQ